jgi:hypothetical protein
MAHQSNQARQALRAYARDLHTTESRGRFAASIGTPKQDDAPTQFLGSGAPHQLAIAAAVVCVVLLGGIGFVSATNATDPAGDELTNPPSAQAASAVAVFARAGGATTSQAIRAFSDLGLPRAAEALDVAASAGTDSSPAVRLALAELVVAIDNRINSYQPVVEGEMAISLAIAGLESAVRPPGLEPNRVPPGLGGTRPGQDPAWLAQVRDNGILKPTADPILVPPKMDKPEPEDTDNGRDTAPGQQKENPGRGGGKP